MKFVRYQEKSSRHISYGYITESKIQPIQGNPFGEYTLNDAPLPIDQARLLSPVEPSKVVALAANYAGATGVTDEMAEQVVFVKPPTSVVGPYDDVVSPFKNVNIWGEAELGIVINRRIKDVSLDEAKTAIGGYVCANDVTADNVEGRDHHLLRSKGADTFCPIGPWMDTAFDPTDAQVESYQNGRLIRQGRLRDRIWKDAQIISWLSQWMTLEQGDVILTGTPPRVVERTYLKDGDIYEVKIEGLGELRNKFVCKRRI